MTEDTTTADVVKDTKPTDHAGDIAHWQAEAKKAFDARQATKREADELRKRLDALTGIDPEEYHALKQEREAAEQDRAKKAGEFDKLQQQLVQKHQTELTAEQQRREAAETRYRTKLVGLEFAGASSLFGEAGKTVLTPAIAEAYFGRFVEVQADEAGNDVVVVKGLDGSVVIDPKTGRPASFADAMTEIIDSLPDKGRILRGSGKVGSGSPGAASHVGREVDLTNLTPQQRRDPKVLAALKDRRPAGGMYVEAYDR